MIVMNDENLSANLGCRSTASAFLFARMTTKVALGAVVDQEKIICKVVCQNFVRMYRYVVKGIDHECSLATDVFRGWGISL
jgi:hypothetical protein